MRGGIGGVRYLRCASWFRESGYAVLECPQVSPRVQIVAVSIGDHREHHRGAVAAFVAADEQPVLTAHRESASKVVRPTAGVGQRTARPFPWRWA